jgi:signal transduction histidine kinase/ActR/RegA family two-component response regulator
MPHADPTASDAPERPSAKEARLATIRLLQILAGAALLLPFLVFALASFVSYRGAQSLADERVGRSLDVMSEHALKVFHSLNLALDAIDNVLGPRADAEIGADGERLHGELRRILRQLPEVQSIWVFGQSGQPLVITREHPPRPIRDFSGEDYFVGPRDGPPGIYIGAIHQSNSGGEPYFTFSRARRDGAGRFLGVIEMSLLPSDFSKFYSHLATGPGLSFRLVRDDGTVLARFPAAPRGGPLPASSPFRRAVASGAATALYTTRSVADGVERRIGVRRVSGFPVYVSAAVETGEIAREWMSGMALHLIFGIPATAFLFGSLLVVLQRTRRLHAEEDLRLQAEAAMRQTQRLDAVGKLTGGVAHDFNNLLMVIIGNLEAAQRAAAGWGEKSKERIERACANAMQGAKRAATLTQRLLAFARLHPLDPRPLDLNKLLNELSDFLSRTVGESIALEIIGAAGLWLVSADQAQLETALLNLASNARDAMPYGGKLTVETSNTYIDEAYSRANAEVAPGQYVLVAVSDTGTGMSRETAEKAFEPFFTTKPVGQGTGLGLSQVYGFVKQSGGHTKIYSEPNEGTTIKIYLPRFFAGAADQRPQEPADTADLERGIGQRILVVEDDDEVRNYVVETLRSIGYLVFEAPNAGAALTVAEEDRFDLLLTDVVLPGINGRQLAETLVARWPDMKVLFMTGYSRNAIVHHGRLDPGVSLLQKPVSTRELVNKVRDMLRSLARASESPS